MNDKQIVDELRRASAGLLVMSESDYPFEIVQWPGHTSITPEYLCRISAVPADSPVEKMGVDDFFDATRQSPKLANLLKNRLAGIQVYKVGKISIPVYIVGRSPEGNWLGLSTRLIQT
jgi:hypothetical protein